MSIAGKCCFEDTVEIFGADNILNKYRVYIGDNILPLRMESEKDLIPYYPYLESIMISNKNDGGVIRLQTDSFINIEEREWITWRLEKLKKYYRKCKRKHNPYSLEEAQKLICWYEPQLYEKELIKRVQKFGEKATIDDLHDNLHEHMRKELYELMLEYGWSESEAYPWVYGWRRYFEKNKIQNEQKDED